MKLKFIFLILFLFVFTSFAQDSGKSLDSLKKMFNSFEYMKVISFSGKLLLNKELTETEKTEILKMKAISHYSLWDEQASELSFLELLKLNRDYELDTRETSPKIVAFFDNIKDNYLFELYKEIAKSDSLKEITIKEPEKSIVIVREQNYDYLKSMILPGWGQISAGETTKGWIFCTLSAAAMVSSVYYIIDANKTENDYLGETNRDLLEERYNTYNSSYKWRNISLVIYTGLWLYSQLDFYFFPKDKGEKSQLSLLPLKIYLDPQNRTVLSYTFNF